MENIYKILVETPEGRMPRVRRKHRSDDNIKMDLKEIGYVWTGFN
jgi:hypothetical protein